MTATKDKAVRHELTPIAVINGILIGLLALGGSISIWLRNGAASQPSTDADASATEAALLHYNLISHGLWLAIVAGILAWLWHDSRQHSPSAKTTPSTLQNLLQQIRREIRLQPIAAIVLAIASLFLISEASWFYKEIIGWYDDINANNLLDNFSLRANLTSETFTRNDFRFYPLAFADLQILSWFTPYVKVWMLFNIAELITTIYLGARIVKHMTESQQAQELLLMFSLLFIATAPAAFSYLQFIYSERILTFLFAIFTWNYLAFQTTRSRKSANLALAAALIGSFCKDTAILLFAIPAATTTIGGIFANHHSIPVIRRDGWKAWMRHFRLELWIFNLSLFFLTSFLYLTYLPSIIAGEARYDAELSMNQIEPDARFIFLIAFSIWSLLKIISGKRDVNLLDGINLAALTYAGGLYWLVGFSSSNYMSLPIHFVAVIDILAIWCMGPRPWLQKNLNAKAITGIGFLCSSAIIYTELQFPGNAYSRIKNITRTHRSWEGTYNQSSLVLREAREQGKEVNVIISKSWFRRFNHLKRLHYDRLIYLNEDSKNYLIIDGKDKGGSYIPRKGDYFLDLDTGKKRMKEFGLNLKDFELIYKYSPNVSNGHIYIKSR